MEKNVDQAALISADILRMIFLLLPRKSILMLQLVCKYWYHIVSDPLFIRNYRAKHTSLFGFFYPTSLVPPIAFIPFSRTATLFTQVACIGGTIVPPNHHITLLDSCNGLLICHFFKLSGPNAGTSAYIVCNPITWQQSRLPPPPVLAGEPKTFLVHGFVSGASSSTCPYSLKS
ncbi:hypothetical protein L1049_024137 [Liquidambar formosana]|uniref:F-box domain-containing protein n=1 Tax=Liquidambar formosana TaxID=63359 RepID=A0AAP0RUD9_LIQFO